MAEEPIKRSEVDNALNNLAEGMRKDEGKLRHNINLAWAQFTEAVKTAKKNCDTLVKAAEKNRKEKLNQAEADYNQQARGPEGASYEAYQQGRAKIKDDCTAEIEHANTLFEQERQDAANKFRTKSGEYIDTFATAISTTVENFKSAHP